MTAPETSPATRREILGFALAVIALTGIVLFLSDGGVLFSRALWVDEVIATLIASRPTPAAVLGDLGSGADGGASLFHLGLWTVRVVSGSLGPGLLRLLALACVLAALVLVYAVLRRGFTRAPSVAGALAIGTNPLVIEHSYEARFYGPWLAFCALIAWLLARRQDRPTRRNGIALGVAAYCLCTIHFYGIITLALLVAGAVLSGWPAWRERLRLVAPAAWGLVSLVVVVPLALAQRRAYTVPSWLPDFTWPQVSSLLAEFWLARVPLAAAFLIVVAMLIRGRSGEGAEAARSIVGRATTNAGIVALMLLALMPVALACLSLLGQPSMLSRYAIAAALVLGPWVAIAVAFIGRWPGRVVIALLAWFWFVGYTREEGVRGAFARSVAESGASFAAARQAAPDMPVLFASTHVMYPVLWPSGLRDRRAAFLDVDDSTYRRLFPDSTMLGQANRVVILERDLARVHARRLGFPAVRTRTSLDSASTFLLLAPFGRLPAGFRGVEHYAQTMFPKHLVKRLQPDLILLERPGTPSTSK